MTTRAGSIIFLASFALAVSAVGQQPQGGPESGDLFALSLDELMNVAITATLSKQPVQKTPASITVVSGETIRSRGYTTIKQVMRDVRGFNDLADSNEDTAGVRGVFTSTNNKYLVMINSHRMNDLTLGRYDLDALIGMGAVERIEFLRGAASSIYGAGALVGAINVITRKDYEGAELSYRIGENNYHKLEFSRGFRLDDAHVLINLVYLDADGEDIWQPARLDHSKNQEGYVNVGRHPNNWAFNVVATSEKSVLTARAEHRQRGTPRLPGGTPGFFDYEAEPIKARWEDTRFFLDYKRTIDLGSNSSLVIIPSFHYSDMDNTSFLLESAEVVEPHGKMVGETATENRFQLKMIYRKELSDALNLTAGTDHLYTKFSDGKTYAAGLTPGQPWTVGPEGSFFPDDEWLMGGYYVQAIWQASSTLEATVNVRYDTFQSQADSRVTSKAAVVYSPGQKFVSKLIYAESYMSPMWQHKHSGNPSFSANPNLDSETFQGFNWITHYNPGEGKVFTLDLFRNEVKDLINSTATSYANSGNITVWGLEVAYDALVSERLKYGASLSYVDPEMGESSSGLVASGKIKSISPLTARYYLSYRPTDGHQVQLIGRWGDRAVMNDNAFDNSLVSVDAHHALDLRYNYQAASKLYFSVFVDNVFDEAYEIGGSKRPMPQPGRLWGLRMSWRF
ncbi:MAG: TonB-dependent receptor [Halieaceae bacterium]|nr:TonB-dependent receptor [Halieaceae bacterium]